MARAQPRAWSEPDQGERRRDRRRPYSRSVHISYGDGGYPCMLENISAGGARLTLSAELPVAADMVLELADYGAVPGRVVYANGYSVAIRFILDESGRRRLQAWIEAHTA
ncbi:MAG: PilZ domain-containing protein [Alphaproteobacteria bacterium]|nr:PilZ domain-containing protein [Alphaproteobacteria bacterium]